MAQSSTRALRWGAIDEAGGPTIMVPVEGVTLEGHGIFVVPATDSQQRGVFTVEAVPLSGADETEASPELLCRVVVITNSKLKGCWSKKREGVLYKVWREDELERMPRYVDLDSAIAENHYLLPGSQQLTISGRRRRSSPRQRNATSRRKQQLAASDAPSLRRDSRPCSRPSWRTRKRKRARWRPGWSGSSRSSKRGSSERRPVPRGRLDATRRAGS